MIFIKKIGEKLLISQLLRNLIWKCNAFHDNLNYLIFIIRRNLHHNEPFIINQICNTWDNFNIINLTSIQISGRNYDVWIEFQILRTHQNYIFISSNDLFSEINTYKTEFGGLALLVDYYVEDEIISRKISIIQSIIDNALNSVDVSIHQLFLMHYWPNIHHSGKTHVFEEVCFDLFSFYHFILRNSYNNSTSSTVCSAPFVSLNLNLNKTDLIIVLDRID